MVDKAQLIGYLAETALSASNIEKGAAVIANLHPVRIMLTSHVAKIASYSLLVVAAGYTTGILFEKVFPNLPRFKRNVLGIRKRRRPVSENPSKSNAEAPATSQDNTPSSAAKNEGAEATSVPVFSLPTLYGLWTAAWAYTQPLRNSLHV
jgi:hypothetical protein